MATYKVMYRRDLEEGVVLAIKERSFEFSDREKGTCVSGLGSSCRCFGVFEMELSGEDKETYENAISVSDALEEGQPIVDDKDNPTTILLYEAP